MAEVVQTPEVREYLAPYDGRLPSIDELWAEMDRVWDALGLDNRAPDPTRLAKFYAHPVWVLNGIFAEQDPESAAHRKAIAAMLRQRAASAEGRQRIADFGGGSGVLAKVVSRDWPAASVDIIEPHPNDYFAAGFSGNNTVRFRPDFSGHPYDFVVAQDVLEHVADPIGEALRCIQATRVGGHLVFANCFQPVIKCHLPITFYLRFTFRFVMTSGALRCLGAPPEAPHAFLYQKLAEVDPLAVRRRARLAVWVGSALNFASRVKAALGSALMTKR